MSKWFKESFPAWAGTASVALLAVVVAQLFSQSSTVGKNSAILEEIRKDISGIEEVVSQTENRIHARFDKLEAELGKIQLSMDINAIDLPAVLASMGTIEKGSSFHAAIIDNHVWVFAGSDEVNQRLLKSGFKREPINNAIAGFKTLPVKTISAQ